MPESRPDVRAKYFSEIAHQLKRIAEHVQPVHGEPPEPEGFLIDHGKSLEALLAYEEARAAFEDSMRAWADAGLGDSELHDSDAGQERQCRDKVRSLERKLTEPIMDAIDSDTRDPVLARLIICELRRRLGEGGVASLADDYASDPVLSCPGTWQDADFPWIKRHTVEHL